MAKAEWKEKDVQHWLQSHRDGKFKDFQEALKGLDGMDIVLMKEAQFVNLLPATSSQALRVACFNGLLKELAALSGPVEAKSLPSEPSKSEPSKSEPSKSESSKTKGRVSRNSPSPESDDKDKDSKDSKDSKDKEKELREKELKEKDAKGASSGSMRRGSAVPEYFYFLGLLCLASVDQLRVPTNKIFVAEISDSLPHLLKNLLKYGFLSVPVLDSSKNRWKGFIEFIDIVLYTLSLFTPEQILAADNFWDVLGKEKVFRTSTVRDAMSKKRSRFDPVSSGYSLFSTLEMFAREQHLQRVPVVSKDGRLSNVITASHLLNFVSLNMDRLGRLQDKVVRDMKQAHTVVSVHCKSKAIDGVKTMIQNGVWAVALVDSAGVMVGVLSIRDIRSVSPDGSKLFKSLYQPIDSVAETVRNAFIAKNNRLPHPRIVYQDTTLKEVVTVLLENHIHIIFVVDKYGKPVSFVGMKDVFHEVIEYHDLNL